MSDEVDVLEDVPILVKLVETEPPEQQAAAGLASFQTYVLQGTEQPFVLLGQDRKRKKATIIVTGNAANSVILARANQVSNKQGAIIPAGTGPIPYEAATQVYCIPNGAAVNVVVIEERYN